MHRFGDDLTIGIEEEYLLVDPETRDLAAKPPSGFMAKCKEKLGGRGTHEFLQAQVEIGTGVCRTVGEARAELSALRGAVSEAAEESGMRLMAASTHPWSHWHEQEPVDMERYCILGAEHRTLARRMSGAASIPANSAVPAQRTPISMELATNLPGTSMNEYSISMPGYLRTQW